MNMITLNGISLEENMVITATRLKDADGSSSGLVITESTKGKEARRMVLNKEQAEFLIDMVEGHAGYLRLAVLTAAEEDDI